MTIYDASALLPLNRTLGERYRLDGTPAAVCRHNSNAAVGIGRWDLAHAWRTAELVARFKAVCIEKKEDTKDDDGETWERHPFGRKLIRSLVTHYAARSDVQMAAMLCCVFGDDGPTQEYSPPVVDKMVTVSRLFYFYGRNFRNGDSKMLQGD